MMKRLGLVLALMASVLVLAHSADANPSMSRGGVSHRLARRGAAGQIAVRAGRKHFPANAEVSLTRTHADAAKRRIKDGLKKKRGARLQGAARSGKDPSVLAMYDISIRAGGKKWQPDADDPVRVDVTLDDPVAVTAESKLAIVHLADDGAVEKLPESRYGFTYNAGKTAVTAFWFDASGFSVYAIENEGPETSSPGRRL
jgi:hypothetical protein